jgi:hypothetical protein
MLSSEGLQFQPLKYNTEFQEKLHDNHFFLHYFQIIYKNEASVMYETYYTSTIMINQLILFIETISVYWKNHTTHKFIL